MKPALIKTGKSERMRRKLFAWKHRLRMSVITQTPRPDLTKVIEAHYTLDEDKS